MNNVSIHITRRTFKGSFFAFTWEQCELGELADIIGGGTPSTAISNYWDGDIDWYSPVEIGDKIYVDGSQNKITQLGLENSSAKILPVGTVLFTSRAGIGKVAILAKQGSTNQGFQSLLPKQDKLDTYFIYSRAEELKRYSETVGAGSTFIEVSGKQLAKMPIKVPDIKEQKKIGDYFEKIDILITLHQRK
ncbi:MAG: restriction endonuclease subunit S [Dehalococcoidales bacterium]